MSTVHHPGRINLKLRDLAQLFNSMDPSPFLDRDLDHDAEEFILSWARELPKGHPLELVIHLTNAPEPQRADDVQSAVQHYFSSRADIKHRDFRQLLRRGHSSLAIGLLFLSTCLIASTFAVRISHAAASSIVQEGLMIAGWVAMWRPLEIYLYDWWPLRAEWQNLRRLAHMHVRLVHPPVAPNVADAAGRPGTPAVPAGDGAPKAH